MLDPDLQEIDRKWKASGIPGLYSAPTGAECRARAELVRREFYQIPEIEVGSIVNAAIPRPGGEIPVRVIRPKGGNATGTVVYFHGGGWVVGSLDSHHAHAARIANQTGSVVVNVGYRLAPEDRFPAAVDDAEIATQWVRDHIGEYGGDPSKLAVGGDSAGGNLAAVVAVYCRDHGIKLAAQLLLYPATDLTKRVSEPELMYFGPDHETLGRDPRASPALTPDLSGLAPAILGVGAYDFLHADNMAYAERLKKAGNALTLREFPTLNHGFFSYTKVSRVSLEAANLLCEDLKRHLHG